MLTAARTSNDNALIFDATIERHHPNLPRFIRLADDPVALWNVQGIFVGEIELNEVPFGRQSVKPWGDGRWFIDLTQKQCSELSVDTGSLVRVGLTYVADPTPADLSMVFASNRKVEANWSLLRPTRRRQLSQWVEEARQPQARQRRVEEIVSMLQRAPHL